MTQNTTLDIINMTYSIVWGALLSSSDTMTEWGNEYYSVNNQEVLLFFILAYIILHLSRKIKAVKHFSDYRYNELSQNCEQHFSEIETSIASLAEKFRSLNSFQFTSAEPLHCGDTLFSASSKKRARRSAIRERCRNLYGNEWYTEDKTTRISNAKKSLSEGDAVKED